MTSTKRPPRQIEALIALEQREPATLPELETYSSAIRVLRTQHQVKSDRPAGQSGALFRLTESGRRKLRTWRKVQKESPSAIAQDLTSKEWVALRRIVDHGFSDDYETVRKLVFDRRIVRSSKKAHRTYEPTPFGLSVYKERKKAAERNPDTAAAKRRAMRG